MFGKNISIGTECYLESEVLYQPTVKRASSMSEVITCYWTALANSAIRSLCFYFLFVCLLKAVYHTVYERVNLRCILFFPDSYGNNLDNAHRTQQNGDFVNSKNLPLQIVCSFFFCILAITLQWGVIRIAHACRDDGVLNFTVYFLKTYLNITLY